MCAHMYDIMLSQQGRTRPWRALIQILLVSTACHFDQPWLFLPQSSSWQSIAVSSLGMGTSSGWSLPMLWVMTGELAYVSPHQMLGAKRAAVLRFHDDAFVRHFIILDNLLTVSTQHNTFLPT